MTGTWSQVQFAAAWIGAGLLLLIDVTLAIALASVSLLSRVALRRMAEDEPPVAGGPRDAIVGNTANTTLK